MSETVEDMILEDTTLLKDTTLREDPALMGESPLKKGKVQVPEKMLLERWVLEESMVPGKDTTQRRLPNFTLSSGYSTNERVGVGTLFQGCRGN